MILLSLSLSLSLSLARCLSFCFIQSWLDNSKRAYYKEFRKVMEAADVVLEVLDARDPLGCRCKSIEEMIQAKWPSKKIVFVLNKIGAYPFARRLVGLALSLCVTTPC